MRGRKKEVISKQTRAIFHSILSNTQGSRLRLSANIIPVSPHSIWKNNPFRLESTLLLTIDFFQRSDHQRTHSTRGFKNTSHISLNSSTNESRLMQDALDMFSGEVPEKERMLIKILNNQFASSKRIPRQFHNVPGDVTIPDQHHKL